MATAAAHNPDWLQERVRENVRVLKSLRKLSDSDIAKLAGFSSRQVISNRLGGRTDLTTEDFARLAAALQVEPHVLMLRVDEAMTWIAEHGDYKAPRYTPQPPMPGKARGAKPPAKKGGRPPAKKAAAKKAPAKKAAARRKVTS